MDEETRQELENIKFPRKEESKLVLSCENNKKTRELGKLGDILCAIKRPQVKPTMGQWEKARSVLMKEIRDSRGNYLTTLKDQLIATDSLVCRLLFYLALLAALTLLAASAFFLYQEFFASPAEAAALVSSFLA